MADDNGLEIEGLRIIYKEIIEGCSFVESPSCFIKHLTELENGELARKKASLHEKFKLEGLQTEAQRVEQMITSGEWSKEREDEIVEARYFISDNEKNLPKVIPQQQPIIEKFIEERRKKLFEILSEKHDLMGLTAEGATERESVSFFLHLTFHKDLELTQKLFPTFEDIDGEDDLGVYIKLVQESNKKFTEENIKKLAIMPFFLNPYANCKDSVYHFLGKPIIKLTSNQLTLFSFGNRNLNIMSQSTGSPPELLGDVKLQSVVDWYDMQYSVILGKKNTVKTV